MSRFEKQLKCLILKKNDQKCHILEKNLKNVTFWKKIPKMSRFQKQLKYLIFGGKDAKKSQNISI